MHMYEALYDVYAGWRVPNSEEFDVRSGSICLIHSARLDTAWRGNGIGLLAVEGLIRAYIEPNHDIAVLRACACEDLDSAGPKSTMKKLADHWALLGFEPCATRNGEDEEVEDMYMSVSALDESQLRQAVPHLFPRRRKYSRKDMIWKDD